MILGFKQQFKEPILKGAKIHTIREDKQNRWRAGEWIHFTTNVLAKEHDLFRIDLCYSIQEIQIRWIKSKGHRFCLVIIDGREIWWDEVKTLAKNDGFDDVKDFYKWFDKGFKGKIIHWTFLRY